MAKAIIEYCPKCDSNYLSDLPHECTMIISKPASLDMSDDDSRVVWNAAIETAASKVKSNNKLMIAILRLKK